MYGLAKIASDENHQPNVINVLDPSMAPVRDKTTIFGNKPSIANRLYHSLTHKQQEYGITREGDYGHFNGVDDVKHFIDQRDNPASRGQAMNQLFDRDGSHRYMNIEPKPLLFGKKKWEQETAAPKRSFALDTQDPQGNYHPGMEYAIGSWVKDGEMPGQSH